MHIYEELSKAGLNKNEIRVYLYLLEQGVSTPPQIARGTHIARTHCYSILRDLSDKALIKKQKKHSSKRYTYFAKSPKALLANLDQKKQALEQIIPELEAFYTVQKNKPKIQFYEGFDQVKDIYEQSLSAKEIYAIGSTNQLQEKHSQFFTSYQKKLKAKNIIMREVITARSYETGSDTRCLLKGLLDQSILPKKYGDLPTDILIWEHNIALITLTDPIFGTIITNPLIANTLKTITQALKEHL